MTVSGYCGWYFRVLSEGIAPVRGSLLRTRTDNAAPNVRDAFFAKTQTDFPIERLREIQTYPKLALSWREGLGRVLQRRET
jgi:MOSC domain-containing protein YiiM